ncbi:MAG: hypothetical protein HRU23_20160 [Gammaproteobacteria bacterium]|nr:hypothetical protein [Gammaproteobacteria bacterium]
MARARGSLIDLSATPYYHVVSRCVRRAYLCGEDKYLGKNYNHRRQWVLDKIHLVLRVDRSQGLTWSQDEVIERWYRLYNGNALVDLYVSAQLTSCAYPNV